MWFSERRTPFTEEFFRFEAAANFLLEKAPPRRRFPFDRELAVAVFFSWVLWPNNRSRQRAVARLVASAIAFRLTEQDGDRPHSVKRLDRFITRLSESEFQSFYKSFFEKVGGFPALQKTYPPSWYDDHADITRGQLNSSLDIVEFLLKAGQYDPHKASRNVAHQFLAKNGFDRSWEFYGFGVGKARKGREPSLSEDRVSQYWDHAPGTLGLAYLLRSTWRELWELKFYDPDILSKLHSLAHNHEMILHFFQNYNWLLEFFDQKLSRILKFGKLEPLIGFADKMPINIEPFTDKQTALLQSAGKRSTPEP
jgi:hypothetical protein